MKNYYLLGLFTLFLGFMVSCSGDETDDGGVSGGKRLTKIEELNGDGDYLLYSYNSDGKLISIEDGDEDGMHERLTLTYDGESFSRIQLHDPELSATMDLQYKEDTVFVFGEDLGRGIVKDTLIINTSLNTLQKLTTLQQWPIGTTRAITYNYDDRGNITSTSKRSENFSYDTNPSFYSTIGVPYWFLNYLYEFSNVAFDYAGPNNILDSYSYEYGADKYPVKIYLTDDDGITEYKITY